MAPLPSPLSPNSFSSVSSVSSSHPFAQTDPIRNFPENFQVLICILDPWWSQGPVNKIVLLSVFSSGSSFLACVWKQDERLLENYIQLFWCSLLPSPPLCLEVLKSIIPFLTCHHNLKVNKILEGLKALPEIEYFDNYNKKSLYRHRCTMSKHIIQ